MIMLNKNTGGDMITVSALNTALARINKLFSWYQTLQYFQGASLKEKD